MEITATFRSPTRAVGVVAALMSERAVPAALSMLLFLIASLAHAQPAWPVKPIRLIVPFPAGGQLDVVARIVAKKVSPALGQPIIIENRTGADGKIGTEFVAGSAPDGYTWLGTSVPFTSYVSLNPQAGYDPVRDFSAVVNLGTSSFVLVVPASLPARNLKEFVAYAKARPGDLSYGSASTGSVVHLSSELFQQAAGTKMVRIPYQGMNTAIPDLITGRTQFMSLGGLLALPLVTAGKLRPLAVLDAERHPLYPDVPTIVEEGYPELTVSTWFGLLVPAHTPRDIVRQINAEVLKALQFPDVLAKYKKMGVNPVKPHGPEVFEAKIKSEVVRWAKVIKEAGIKPD